MNHLENHLTTVVKRGQEKSYLTSKLFSGKVARHGQASFKGTQPAAQKEGAWSLHRGIVPTATEAGQVGLLQGMRGAELGAELGELLQEEGGAMISGRFQSDAVTRQLVKDAREEGLTVYYWIGVNRQKGQPDLVIPYGGTTYLVEVKSDDGELSPDQEKWHAAWAAAGGGPILTVHNFAELMIGIGAGEAIHGQE